MSFRRFVLLFSFTLTLNACTTDSGPAAPASDTLALRTELSSSMSSHRVLSYSQVWDALSAIHEVAPGKIQLFYTQRVVNASDRASGDGQSNLDNWNREHLWPQSFGIRTHPAKTDLHNLVPADQTVNSSRGNKYFDRGSVAHRECIQCWTTTESWDPPDEVKGDIARMMFYVDVRYEGTTNDNVGDLSLGVVPDAGNKVFGNLNALLEWHCSDPVSEEEVRRHEMVAAIQGNRNAFVDSPALVSYVYDHDCWSGY